MSGAKYRFSVLVWSVSASIILLSCTQGKNHLSIPTPLQAKLVLIPGGAFLMGDSTDGDHSPVHEIYLDSFYLDQDEVTNDQYYRYCQETASTLPEFWGMAEFHSGPEFPNHPVVGISAREAEKFAEWRGLRLPTEAEWEYAARGGLVQQKYPNGNEIDSTLVNYTINGETIGVVPVGSYPPNAFGLHDMAGNVVEWVADLYDGEYYALSSELNPPGPEKGRFRVIRGGGWHSGPYCNRVYFRNALPPVQRDFNVGFRCARDLHPPSVADSTNGQQNQFRPHKTSHLGQRADNRL